MARKTDQEKRQDYQREYRVAVAAIKAAGFKEPIQLDVAMRYLPVLPEYR